MSSESQNFITALWDETFIKGVCVAVVCLLMGTLLHGWLTTSPKKKRDRQENTSSTEQETVAVAAAASSSSSSPQQKTIAMLSQTLVSPADNYEVFLSFRGEDTRATFTDHLYQTLIERGIRTFRDNEELPRGEAIKPNLDLGMNNSEIIIPIISDNTATSGWCLDELVTIAGSNKIIIPVFYHVDPSDVRKQKGPFKKSFDDYECNSHISKERVAEWRKAMATIATRAGYNVKKDSNSHEGELVRTIARELLVRLRKGYMNVGKLLSGMDSPVRDVVKLLDIDTDQHQQETVMVGIYGMGGLGKTTLAQMVYNEIFQNFEYACFVESVRRDDIVSMQKRIASEFSKESSSDSKIHSSSEATELLRRSLNNKKVLLVIDDVDDKEQLNALAGDLNWFGMGSRIIITTRDPGVFASPQMEQYCRLYEPSTLDVSDSLIVFSRHAFGKDAPETAYEKFAENIVSLLGGLPLALEVIGSFMFRRRRDKKQWLELIKNLERAPNAKVEEKLKITFDGLMDESTKVIFLDVVSFFIGGDVSEAICMWEAHDLCPKMAIQDLLDKSLLKIDENGRFCMHDIIRDMGRHIISQESEKVGGRSWIWKSDEAGDILQLHSKGSESVEDIAFDYERGEMPRLQTSDFREFSNLRFLSIEGVDHLDGDFTCFPQKLNWLNWSRCNLKQLPDELGLKEIGVLRLRDSWSLKQLWYKKRVLPKLNILDLEGCSELKSLPHDLSSTMPNLERLILRRCERLEEITDSVCNLTHLRVLDMTECKKVKRLPEEFGNHMKSLKILILDGTAIKELPTFLRCLTELKLFYYRPHLHWSFDLDERIIEDVVVYLTKLIDLRLPPDAQLVGKLFNFSERLPHLRTLHFANSSLFMSDRVEYSSEQYNSTSSSISVMEENNDDYACTTSHQQFPTPLIHLQELTIDGEFNDDDDDDSVEVRAFSHLPSLLKLELRSTTLTKKLWKVEMEGREEEEEGSNSIIASPAPLLQQLTLEFCRGIEALPYLPSLKRLQIVACRDLKKAWETANYAPANLEMLQVFECPNLISWSSEEYDLPKLRELDTDHSLKTYLMRRDPPLLLPSLQTLNLREWNLEEYGGKAGPILNWLNTFPKLSHLTIGMDLISLLRSGMNLKTFTSYRLLITTGGEQGLGHLLKKKKKKKRRKHHPPLNSTNLF